MEPFAAEAILEVAGDPAIAGSWDADEFLGTQVIAPRSDVVAQADEGEAVTFSPCGMWYHT